MVSPLSHLAPFPWSWWTLFFLFWGVTFVVRQTDVLELPIYNGSGLEVGCRLLHDGFAVMKLNSGSTETHDRRHSRSHHSVDGGGGSPADT